MIRAFAAPDSDAKAGSSAFTTIAEVQSLIRRRGRCHFAPLWLVLVGNPTRKRGLRPIFLAYASGYQVFKQHQFVLAALDTKPSRSDLHSIAGKTFLN